MSARTCQLCGKPLSRIWVGAGGDFCSREHRNQYQLRQGMDRLLEASQVANLMRRRETPKPILASSIESAQPLVQRGFFELKPVSSSRKRERVWPRVQPAGGPRRKPGSERFLRTVLAQTGSRRGAVAEARLAGLDSAHWGLDRGPRLRQAPGWPAAVALESAPASGNGRPSCRHSKPERQVRPESAPCPGRALSLRTKRPSNAPDGRFRWRPASAPARPGCGDSRQSVRRPP